MMGCQRQMERTSGKDVWGQKHLTPLRNHRQCNEMESIFFSGTPFRDHILWGWKDKVVDGTNSQHLESDYRGPVLCKVL